MRKFHLFTGLYKKALLAGSLLLAAGLSSQAQSLTDGLKLHYTFETANGSELPDVSGNGYDGLLMGATIGVTNGKPSLILSATGTDWVDMGANTGNLVASLTDFSMSCYVWVNSSYTKLGNNGNMIATFSNSLDSYNQRVGYMFLQAKRSRYSITTDRYEAEEYAQGGGDVAKGKWVHLAYTQTGNVGKFYVDGVLKQTNNNVTLTPSVLGATPYNMLAKPSYSGDLYLQDTQLSDFRIYNRGISSDEVLMLNGYPADLIQAYNALVLGDLSAVVADITLPATAGTAQVPVTWASTMPEYIAVDGKVNRPDKYDASVKLTATLTMTVGETSYTLTKEFLATVPALNMAGERLAKWTFSSENISVENGEIKVLDDSESGFVGTVKNEARIRTIGTSQQFNVLDLGNGKGYFDMGTDIGEVIYSLTDYTMCGYFRIDEDYNELNSNGNFIWTFSNTADAAAERNGYIIGSLKALSQSVSTNYWDLGNQAVGAGAVAEKGSWHHFAYVQSGTTGTVYVDGVEMKSGTITNLPSTALLQPGRKGTLYNWLGRSNYVADVYLRKALLYDFQLLRVPLTASDINDGIDGLPAVALTLDQLNNAYAENPDVILPELTAEQQNFTLNIEGDVTSDITLPTVGQADPTVLVSWTSSNPAIIDNTGKVTLPDYYAYNVILTANFTKGGQKLTREFTVRVAAKEGTAYTGDLLLKHDFSSYADSVVYDVAEKQFPAVMKNGAKVVTIGTTNTYKVLDLGADNGYLDLGENIGKVMYHQNDFTMGGYFRIDESHDLTVPGSFLWTFSNTVDPHNNAKGYLIGILKDQSISISPKNWDSATGQQAVGFAQPAIKGDWHHFAYTQQGTTGTIWIDGMQMNSAEITNTPANTLARPEYLGTLYNWLGRSCYSGDVYLKNTMLYDFRIYSRSLTAEEIQTTKLNISETLGLLNVAYSEGVNALKSIGQSRFVVVGEKGRIEVRGLESSDKVSVVDLSGRRISTANRSQIDVNPGVYIVRINDYATKVVVR